MNPLIKMAVLVAVVGAVLVYGKIRASRPMPAKNPIDYNGGEFSYTELLAESPKDIDTDKGPVTRDTFITAFESFPWNEQMKKANEIKVQSPTLTLKDNVGKKALIISMAGQPEDSKVGVGYIVAYSWRDESGKDVLIVKQTQNKQALFAIVEKFFTVSAEIKAEFLKLQ